MDPLSLILSALVIGIAAGLKPTAEAAVKDAYNGVKTIIQNRYLTSLDNLEKNPTSDMQISAVKDSLVATSASTDSELLEKARKLVEVVEEHDPRLPTTIGVNIRNVKMGLIKFAEIQAGKSTTGVLIEGGQIDTAEFGPVSTEGDNDPN